MVGATNQVWLCLAVELEYNSNSYRMGGSYLGRMGYTSTRILGLGLYWSFCRVVLGLYWGWVWYTSSFDVLGRCCKTLFYASFCTVPPTWTECLVIACVLRP